MRAKDAGNSEVQRRGWRAALPHYTGRARAVLDGSWRAGDVWGGIREGMVSVGGFGPKVPRSVQDEVLSRQKDIAAGRRHPFQAPAGRLRDNQGNRVADAGKTLSDAQILGMNWLVEGVQGKVR